MNIAITGGTGFIGRHLAEELRAEGHEVVALGSQASAVKAGPKKGALRIGLDDVDKLAEAFAGCDVVAHCAGINREIGRETYQRVHVEGTRHVVTAAKQAGVRKIVFISFLRARPECGSKYHESKWTAEEIVRASGLDYTILKPGVIYGKGDHMLDHLSHAFHTFPVFAFVGMKDQLVRPTAVADLVRVLRATVVENRLSRETVAVTGPEEITLRTAVQRVARVVGKRPLMFRLPLAFHYTFGWLLERLMKTPLVAVAQVRILSEGVVDPLPPCAGLPLDLATRLPFSEELIRRGLPEPKGFGLTDLRFCHR